MKKQVGHWARSRNRKYSLGLEKRLSRQDYGQWQRQFLKVALQLLLGDCRNFEANLETLL